MKGSIQAKNGKLYPVIYDRKRKKHKWGTGCTTQRQAEAGLRKLIKQYEDDTIRWDETPTFQMVYNDWHDMIMPESYKSMQSIKTAEGYARKHILPFFGNIEIDLVELKDIQKFFYKMKVTKWVDDPHRPGKKMCTEAMPTPATKKKIFSILNSILKAAKGWGLIDSNPGDDIVLKSPDIQKKEVWTSDTIAYFFGLPEVQNSIYYLPLLILATTGMSRSEVCGLSWADYHDSYFILYNGMDVFGNLTEMKAKNRRRRIDLMEITSQAINAHRDKQTYIGRILHNAPQICQYIVTDNFNQPINPKRITDGFSSLIDQINKNHNQTIKKIPLKNLRHSFASMMIYESEENIKIVSEVLGHARTSTTQNFYQAEALTLHRPAMQKLENKIFAKEEKPLDKPLENAT